MEQHEVETLCPQCGGERPISLGLFGDVFYFRCRFCGWGWGEWKNPPADPPPDPKH